MNSNNYRVEDDLFRFINGKWLEETEIPDDKSRWGSFDELNEDSLKIVKELLKETPESEIPLGKKLYNSVINVKNSNDFGAKPLLEIINEYEECKNWDDLVKLIKQTHPAARILPFSYGVSNDLNNPDYNTLFFAQGGLSLPEKSYYFEEEHQTAKEKYINVTQNLFEIIKPNIASANNLIDFETKIAEFHWDIALTRDIEKINNPVIFSDFASKYDDLLINDTICYQMNANECNKIKNTSVIVAQKDFFEKVSELWCSENFDSWKNWIISHLIIHFAGSLSEEIEDAAFKVGQVFSGAISKPPRWKKAVSIVNSYVGDEIGKIYVDKYYPQAARVQMQEMIDNLIKAYRVSIKNAKWLTNKTKEKALEKLGKFRAEIGFPSHWHQYSLSEYTLEFTDSLFQNVVAFSKFSYYYNRSKVGEKVDKQLWHMTPQTVNAYYNPPENVIVFPAAILQHPFFDLDREVIMNYGGIGAVIGHEIGHGFDDQGSKFDGDGLVKNWWSDEDQKQFTTITTKLANQFSNFTPLQLENENPKPKVNGKFTTGENVGDVSGLKIALLAYSLKAGFNSIDELIDDNPELIKQFFYAFGIIWRGKSRDEYAKMLLAVDPHSPAEFRANTVRNLDAFHKVFNTKKGDGLYLEPEKRIDLW